MNAFSPSTWLRSFATWRGAAPILPMPSSGRGRECPCRPSEPFARHAMRASFANPGHKPLPLPVRFAENRRFLPVPRSWSRMWLFAGTGDMHRFGPPPAGQSPLPLM
jgi:hypothetical protein